MVTTAPSSDTLLLLDHLKRIFKSHGLTYVEIAKQIGICEKTMKRYMVGKGVTFAVFDKLCRVVGLTHLDLAELVSKHRQEHPFVSTQFEEAMSKDLFTGLVFALLRRGWDARDLPVALDVEIADITASLTKLDRLGVIELHPQNRIKVLATVKPGDRAPRRAGLASLKKSTFDAIRNLMHEDAAELVWRVSLARLPADQLPVLGKMYDEFLDRVYEIEAKYASDPDANWYQLPFLAGPAQTDFKRLQTPSGG